MNRQVSLSGQPNFRDLGGYATRDGRTVKWGTVFRSGELGQLTDGDVETLSRLGIKTVVDLRSAEEVAVRGRSRIPDGAQMVAIPVASNTMLARLIPMFLQGDFSQVPADLLFEVNRTLVRDFTEQYARLLDIISKRVNRPIVFHCTQGKDRAGFGAAVFLLALGVPWETVVEDYLLSNHYRKADNDKLLGLMRTLAAARAGADGEQSLSRHVEDLVYVKEQNLSAALAEIVDRYGSVQSYLMEGLGASQDRLNRLRDELLE